MTKNKIQKLEEDISVAHKECVAHGKTMGMNDEEAIKYADYQVLPMRQMLEKVKQQGLSTKREPNLPPRMIDFSEKPPKGRKSKKKNYLVEDFRPYVDTDLLDIYEELDQIPRQQNTENHIFNTMDKYNHFLLDYMVDMNARNGLKFLVYKHKLMNNVFGTQYFYIDDFDFILSKFPAPEVAKYIIDSNDEEIFTKVFDPFKVLLKADKVPAECIFVNDIVIRSLLNNDVVFHSLFNLKTYRYTFLNKKEFTYIDEDDITVLNPLLNICLEYALKHLDKYREQALEILNFGKQYNQRVYEEKIDKDKKYFVRNFGSTYDEDNRFITNFIISNITTTKDEEIDSLLSKLPKVYSAN